MSESIELVIATKNPKKLAEMDHILGGLDVCVVGLDTVAPDVESPDETGKTFEDNARLKALYFAEHTGRLCVADDSGLEVDALDGAPGVYSSRYAGVDGDDARNNSKLIEALRDVPDNRRGAQFRSVIAVAIPGRVLAVTEGVVRGRIVREANGVGGFGYDPYFFHDAFGRTFAEVAPEKKASVSHRGQALRSLKERLADVMSEIERHRG